MTEQAANNEAQKGQFGVQRIFVKDVSFESPNAPDIFRSQWKPQINLDLNTKSEKLGDDLYEVVLTLTVTAKNDEKTAFLAEVHQGGIFKIEGLEGAALSQTIGAFCPNLLFPYAREAIDNLVTKGSFPALMLSPVNFDAIYAQSVQRAQQQAQPQGESTH
ncbi:protein-export chaperone SecB [Bermanella sp. R86510]|uniref:protein-export chaperone SecB n=1 Tax=unclassified Bermanella TaxID=2627862 RepID=UPI0037C7D4A3